jgi:phosphatidylglycerophosphatase A
MRHRASSRKRRAEETTPSSQLSFRAICRFSVERRWPVAQTLRYFVKLLCVHADAPMAMAPVSARWLATWFGCGRFPVAPGTIGALGALPLHLALRAMGPIPHAIGSIAVTVLGVWAAQRMVEATGDDDPSSVVIDEVAGTLIALGIAAPAGITAQIAAFLAFRVLDIAKPGVIDDVQSWRPAGVGIMADDVLAGIGAGLIARLLTW